MGEPIREDHEERSPALCQPTCHLEERHMNKEKDSDIRCDQCAFCLVEVH